MIPQLKKILERYGIHAFLLPVFFALHNYIQYYGLVSAAITWKTLAGIEAIFLLFFLLLLLFTRSAAKSLLIVTLSGIILLFYGVIKDFINSTLGWSFIARYTILLPALVLADIALLCFLLRKNRFNKNNLFLNLLLIIFIAIDGISLTVSKNPLFYKQNLLVKNNIVNIDQLPPPAARPDVYYLLFDCYPGTRYLRDYMQYDNTALDDSLRSKGFYIVSNSRSNYHGTALSLSSTLNFEYLDGIHPNQPTKPKQYNAAQLSILHAAVPQVFAHYGYKTINLSIFDLAGAPSLHKCNFLALPEQQVLLYNTLTERLRLDILWNFTAGKYKLPLLQKMMDVQYSAIVATATENRNYNNTVIDSILNLPAQQDSSPRFVYAHFYLPHPPFFYDKNGTPNNLDSVITPNGMRNKALFLSYLEYTNKVMLSIIGRIQQASGHKALVIVQGDHGFRDFTGGPKLHEVYFKNYSAFYFPDKDYTTLYDTLSNINTFPLIFNKYFNTHIPLQKDSTIF